MNITTKALAALSCAVAAGILFSGCQSTTTTVLDSRTGRPLAGARITESDGNVIYTGADGTVKRGSDTTARVSRGGYRPVTLNR